MSAAYSEFFQGGSTKFCRISKRIFFGRIISEKHIENKKGPRGFEGMLLQKIFKKFHTVVAILVLIKQFLG